nr:ribonuclease H-like domain-containing protein [Tanacetum cinerariifolium]
LFQDNKRTRTVALKGELRMLHMGDQSVDKYFSKINSLVTLLSDLGLDVSEDDVVTYAINGLSHKYESLAQIIAHKDPFPDLATMRSMVNTEKMRLRSISPIQPTNMTASAPQVLLATSNIPRGGDNHNTRNRDNRKPNTSTEEMYHPQALNTMTLQEPADLNWNMDTAASSHLNSSTSIDVNETFSPVVKPATIRTVLSLAISRHWPVHQLDVKNAFLNGYLSETVYMQQLLGFRDSQHPDYVCLLQRIITSLHAEFSMTDLGPLNYFFGVSITRDTFGMFLSQQKYATEVLESTGMLTYNPCRNSVDTDSKLSVDVQQVCLFMHDPREPYFSALKRILRYVRGTLSYGLQLYSSTTSTLVAYSDADWAGCPTTPEYRGVVNAVAETCWLRNLLREFHTPLSTATLVYCDNVSVVYLSSNPVQRQRTKHIEIDIHFVRDLGSTGRIRVLHVPSHYQYTDIFTKGLPTALFDEFRSSLSVRSSPAQTAGGC